MGIVSIQRIEVGQVGIRPGRVKVLTTNNLATITAAGYFNGANLQGITIGPLDVLEIMYSYNASTGTASWGDFLPTITNGIISIAAAVSPGDVLLPVVSGNFPIFNGTSGQIKDSLMSATDPAKTKLVALNAAPTINHVAIFTSANGTIGDGGVLGTAASKAASDNTKPIVASVSAATTIGQLAQFNDITGTIGNSGVLTSDVVSKSAINTMAAGSSIVLAKVNGTEAANAMTANGVAGIITTSALTTAGGATYAITWTNSFISATSSILLTLGGGTNTIKNITLEVIRGAGTATLNIYNNTAATALDGTIIMNYAVL